MSTSTKDKLQCLDKKSIGFWLLVIVNILWVASSEITRFIFVDEDFKRPFFTFYVRSCTLLFYMVRYLITEAHNENSYAVLQESPTVNENSSDTETYEMNTEGLSHEGFESITEDSDVESFVEGEGGRHKKMIRFSGRKEIRRMPLSNAEEQRKARLPYRHPSLDCQFQCFPRHIKYTIFYFAPLWLVCSFTYQAALAFTSVSSLNLVSSSASVFILIFSICSTTPNNRFTLYKASLVIMNICGVLIVSKNMPSFFGAFFAQISAFADAIYLFSLAPFESQFGRININLMFGSIGVITLVIGTPMLNLLDVLGIESLYPLPTATQLSSILISAIIGNIIGDYVWVLGAGMVDSITASLSLTMGIPMSFFADAILRKKYPGIEEILASIPIVLAFVGAAYAQNGQIKRIRKRKRYNSKDDNEQLINEDQDGD